MLDIGKAVTFPALNELERSAPTKSLCSSSFFGIWSNSQISAASASPPWKLHTILMMSGITPSGSSRRSSRSMLNPLSTWPGWRVS